MALREVLQRWAQDPEAFAAEHFGQITAVNERCTWQRRAAEWEEVIGVFNELEFCNPQEEEGRLR